MVRRLIALGFVLCATFAGAPASVDRLGPAPPEKPRRVVTLAPSLTDIVLALGAGERLVGVSRYDDFEAVKGLPRVGGYLDPNLEVILSLRPDLLIVEPSPGNREVVMRLAELGVPVRVVRAATLTEVHQAIRVVGRDLGLAARGIEVSETLARDLERVRRATEGLRRPRTLLVYGHEPLVVAAPGSFGHELLLLAGGTNVVDSAPTPYPSYPLETLVTLDPEVIVDLVVHAGGGARPAPFSHLDRITAVRTGRVVRVTSMHLLRPGPGLGQGVAELFGVLHPKAAPPE